MSKGVVVIKVGKRPSNGVVESIVTASSHFGIPETQIQSLIDSGGSFDFNGETYYFDEVIE